MSSVKLIPNYTYDDYRRWEGRWELIDGIPFAMSPVPSLRHQWVNANIISSFKSSLNASCCQECRVYDFIDIRITDSTIVQQDCSVVCAPAEGDFLGFPPALAVEVLSKSTSLKDRHTKYALYQNFGIKYYLIVNPDTGETEIYRLEDKAYAQTKVDGANTFTFEFQAGCHIQIDIGDFWK